MEARQRKDLLLDLSSRLKNYQTAFRRGDGVWYWDRDPGTNKDGVWIRAKALGAEKPPNGRYRAEGCADSSKHGKHSA